MPEEGKSLIYIIIWWSSWLLLLLSPLITAWMAISTWKQLIDVGFISVASKHIFQDLSSDDPQKREYNSAPPRLGRWIMAAVNRPPADSGSATEPSGEAENQPVENETYPGKTSEENKRKGKTANNTKNKEAPPPKHAPQNMPPPANGISEPSVDTSGNSAIDAVAMIGKFDDRQFAKAFAMISKIRDLLYQGDDEGRRSSILTLIDKRLLELEDRKRAIAKKTETVRDSLAAQLSDVEHQISASLARQQSLGVKTEQVYKLFKFDVRTPAYRKANDVGKEEPAAPIRNPLGMCPVTGATEKPDTTNGSKQPEQALTKEVKVYEIPIGPVVVTPIEGDQVHWEKGEPPQLEIAVRLNQQRIDPRKGSAFQNPRVLLRVFRDCVAKIDILRNEKQAKWVIDGYANGSFNDIYFISNEFGRTLLMRIPDAKRGCTAGDTLLMRSSQATVNLLKLRGINASRCLFIEPTGNLLPFLRTDGSPRPGLRFSIEEKLKGMPTYKFWDEQQPLRDHYRAAIMEGIAGQMAQMYREQLHSKWMGMLDPAYDLKKKPANGFYPTVGFIGYYAADQPFDTWITQDIFQTPRLTLTDLRYDCAIAWRTSMYRRWRQSLDRSPLDENDQFVYHATLNVFDVVLKVINRRIQVDDAKHGQIFTIGHPDLDVQNVLADRPAPPIGQTRYKTKVSLIDLDDAKFMPQDRGYLAYPLFLMKSHYFAEHNYEYEQMEGRTPADYAQMRKQYTEILIKALGSTSEAQRLVKTWTYGSHIVRCFDSALEWSLSLEPGWVDKVVGPAYFTEALVREIKGLPRRTSRTESWAEEWRSMDTIRRANPDQYDMVPKFQEYVQSIESGLETLLSQP